MTSRTFTIARFSAVIAGASLAFTACGGSDLDLSRPGEAPVASVDGSVAPTGGGDWCDFASDSKATEPLFIEPNGAPSKVKSDVAALEASIVRLRADAPKEISGPVTVFADTMEQVAEATKAADYDPDKADRSFLEDNDSALELSAAMGELDTYTERECGTTFIRGVDLGSIDDSGSDGPVVSGTDPGIGGTGSGSTGSGSEDPDFDKLLRDEMTKQFTAAGYTAEEANCMIDSLDLDNPDSDVDDMISAFDKCGVDPARLAQLGN